MSTEQPEPDPSRPAIDPSSPAIDPISPVRDERPSARVGATAPGARVGATAPGARVGATAPGARVAAYVGGALLLGAGAPLVTLATAPGPAFRIAIAVLATIGLAVGAIVLDARGDRGAAGVLGTFGVLTLAAMVGTFAPVWVQYLVVLLGALAVRAARPSVVPLVAAYVAGLVVIVDVFRSLAPSSELMLGLWPTSLWFAVAAAGYAVLWYALALLRGTPLAALERVVVTALAEVTGLVGSACAAPGGREAAWFGVAGCVVTVAAALGAYLLQRRAVHLVLAALTALAALPLALTAAVGPIPASVVLLGLGGPGLALGVRLGVQQRPPLPARRTSRSAG